MATGSITSRVAQIYPRAMKTSTPSLMREEMNPVWWVCAVWSVLLQGPSVGERERPREEASMPEHRVQRGERGGGEEEGAGGGGADGGGVGPPQPREGCRFWLCHHGGVSTLYNDLILT